MPPTYYRAVPARGTHPGPFVDHDGDFRQHQLFEHDPRGYHPDWQRGWQEGYTYGWREWCYGGHVPRDVDEEQWNDGFQHGVNVGTYDGMRRYREKNPQPSPWWRDPRAEAPDGYQTWTVLITVPSVPGSTPHDAAARAWEALTCDRPPVVEVYPTTGLPADAVEIDLATDPHEDDT